MQKAIWDLPNRPVGFGLDSSMAFLPTLGNRANAFLQPCTHTHTHCHTHTHTHAHAHTDTHTVLHAQTHTHCLTNTHTHTHTHSHLMMIDGDSNNT